MACSSLSNLQSNRSHSQLVKRQGRKKDIKSIVLEIFEDSSTVKDRNITKSLSKTGKCARKFVDIYNNVGDAYDCIENEECQKQVAAQSEIARQQMKRMMSISYS